jgi:alkyldihydroxyacetonephosphate synthase
MTTLRGDLSRALPALRASDDEADRVAYARDLWPRAHLARRAGWPIESKPGAIAWPRSTSEVAELVRWARAEGVPLIPFGAGSGVCAGVQPNSRAVVVDLKRMAAIRRLDPGAPLVEVEAGHMGVPLERALHRAGLTLGHFPSSILCSTVGGWVATRSAGQCSGAYGKIEDMTVALECVTGDASIVSLARRSSGPDLVPLILGSEGTLALVTCATLRLHPAPRSQSFGAWSFAETEQGWEAMRALFQAGLRPAIARLYDPFDAMLARQSKGRAAAHAPGGATRAPGVGGAVLRTILRRPRVLNDLLHSPAAARALGGALLVAIFEGTEDSSARGMEETRRIAKAMRGTWEGEGHARSWLQRRYAVSYRQAPVFANGSFVDTFEVAARWSDLGRLYEGVRRALGEHVFVMAHFSHAYPDGCCIYFSFAGTAGEEAGGGQRAAAGWEEASVARYDRAWKAALAAAVDAGGTLAHHHGVGRSKAPRLPAELGEGIGVVRALMRAFDPAGILNPGNLLPSTPTPTPTPTSTTSRPIDIDRQSLLVRVDGGVDLGSLEGHLSQEGLTLVVVMPVPSLSVAEWLERGAPGARDRWLDPVDHLVAGLDATLPDGRKLSIRPAPRRSVGPDLLALFVATGGRFGRIDRAWLRVHGRGTSLPTSPPFEHDRDPALADGERALLAAIDDSLAGRPRH